MGKNKEICQIVFKIGWEDYIFDQRPSLFSIDYQLKKLKKNKYGTNIIVYSVNTPKMENMLQNIDLIHRYLSLSITNEFSLNIDLEGEYTFAQNIVSKKMIIAATFTNKILVFPELKLFLSALISEINNGNCTVDFMRERVRYFEGRTKQPLRRII